MAKPRAESQRVDVMEQVYRAMVGVLLPGSVSGLEGMSIGKVSQPAVPASSSGARYGGASWGRFLDKSGIGGGFQAPPGVEWNPALLGQGYASLGGEALPGGGFMQGMWKENQGGSPYRPPTARSVELVNRVRSGRNVL